MLVERAKEEFANDRQILKRLLDNIDQTVAERNVFVATERLREIENSGPAGGAPNLRQLRDHLENFESLLSKTGTLEEELKQFLKAETSRFIFGLDAIRTYTEHELGKEFRTDFVVEYLYGRFVVVELERSDAKLYTKNGKSAALTHGAQQIEDWQQWFAENNLYAQKSLPGCVSPEGLLVIGLRRSLSETDTRRLRQSNIATRGNYTVLTYDDLLERAKVVLDNLEASQDGRTTSSAD